MTTVQRIADRGINPALARAVIRQLGGGKDALENLRDIASHGIDGGFHGFIYTVDTVAFYKRHREAIVDLVEQMASDLGETPIDMVAGFNCLGGSERKSEYQGATARALYGSIRTDEDRNVANALAWFAGEEVARAFVDAESDVSHA